MDSLDGLLNGCAGHEAKLLAQMHRQSFGRICCGVSGELEGGQQQVAHLASLARAPIGLLGLASQKPQHVGVCPFIIRSLRRSRSVFDVRGF